jgi:DNA-binding GntR family transcriptional regulator
MGDAPSRRVIPIDAPRFQSDATARGASVVKNNRAVIDVLTSETSPVERPPSLAAEVADKLRDLILLEKLPPGEPVPEREFAAALGVSRTPLREAIRLLEHEGLIEFTKTRRPFVAAPPLEEILENLLVLGALEALAGELACQLATDDDVESIDALRRQMEQMSNSADPLDFFRTDMAFHRAIVSASGNMPLCETHRMYNARLWRARFMSSRRRRNREITLEEHRRISEALMKRDPDLCGMTLRAHLSSTAKNIQVTE